MLFNSLYIFNYEAYRVDFCTVNLFHTFSIDHIPKYQFGSNLKLKPRTFHSHTIGRANKSHEMISVTRDGFA